MRQSIFWVGIIGFSLGVLWRSFFDWGLALIALLLFCALISLAAYFLRKKQVVFLVCTVLFLACAAGVVRFAMSEHTPNAVLVERDDTRVTLEGTVVAEPDERDSYTQLVMETQGERVLIYAPQYPKVMYGDRISVTGTLSVPEVIAQDDGRVFLYPQFLKKEHISFLIKYPKVAILSHSDTWSMQSTLFSIKNKFLEALENVLPEPHVSLLAGLVVGAKQALGKDLLEAFRIAGVVHIVVLSGYNVTIIAKAVMSVLSSLPRIWGFGAGSAFIVLFAILTGGSATIVRASIMALLVFVAEASDRKFDPLRALFVAAFLMVLHNPRILAFDPSFQLSFLATFGLVVFGPYFEKKLQSVPQAYGLRAILAATFATQLTVLPLLLWMNGTLSLVAPLVNMLVLPTVPFAMLAGFVTGIVAMASTALGSFIGLAAYAILSYELWIVEIIATLPLAAVQMPAFSFWLVVGAYAMLILPAYRIAWRRLPS